MTIETAIRPAAGLLSFPCRLNTLNTSTFDSDGTIHKSACVSTSRIQATMTKRILNVGQCCRDHDTIERYLQQHFPCEVESANTAHDTIELLQQGRFDLVLVNRKLDIDYTDGIEVIRRLKANAATAGVPVMLITNYAEHQELAVAAGALHGFGKLEFDKPATRERIAAALENRPTGSPLS